MHPHHNPNRRHGPSHAPATRNQHPPGRSPAKGTKKKPSCGPIRAFSYGGGWQSTAALVLAAQGHIDFDRFLFANVGDDSEHPATLRYIREHAAPYAAAHG
ncbi:hypothetical protein AB0C35_45775, partial [Spirillospora sp. NPDC048819]